MRAGRAEDYAALYRARLAAHRDALADAARSLGWTFSLHSTERPASDAMLNLRLRADRGWRAMSLLALSLSSLSFSAPGRCWSWPARPCSICCCG